MRMQKISPENRKQDGTKLQEYNAILHRMIHESRYKMRSESNEKMQGELDVLGEMQKERTEKQIMKTSRIVSN